MRSFQLILVAALLIGAASSPLRGELGDPCGCNAGLVPEVKSQMSDQRLYWAFLKQIDKEQYEKLEKTVETSGNYLEIAKGTGNYGEFAEKRDKYLATVSYSVDAASSQSYLLSRIQTAEWGKCKKACIERLQGFYCDVSELTSTLATASCSWKVPGAQKPRTVEVVANLKAQAPTKIPPNTTRDWQFVRDPMVDLVLTFSLENDSSRSIKIERTPTIAQPKGCKSIYLKQEYTTEGDGRVSKNLSCPEGMVVVPGSAKCLLTAPGVLKSSYQVGDDTWVCVWEPQPIGVGMWVEMGCQCK
jgi:hypothetical protein